MHFTYNTPLRFTIESHNLAQVMNEPTELEPFLVRMLLPDPLSSLESMNNVGQLCVRVTLVHKIIQHDESLHDGAMEMVELQPLLMLPLDKGHRLLSVHVVVGLLDPLADLILLGIVPEGIF